MTPLNQSSIAVSFFRGELTATDEDIALDSSKDYLITDIEYGVGGDSDSSELILSDPDGGAPYFALFTAGGDTPGSNLASWHGEMIISNDGFHIFTSIEPAIIAISGYALTPPANSL